MTIPHAFEIQIGESAVIQIFASIHTVEVKVIRFKQKSSDQEIERGHQSSCHVDIVVTSMSSHSHSDPESNEELSATRPKNRGQVRSSTPPNVALGEPPIVYRKKSEGPVKVQSARKKVQLPRKRTLAARDPEDLETGEEPPKQRPYYHPTVGTIRWMPRTLARWREMESIPFTFELGESSNSPTPLPHTGEAMELTVPKLVARVHTHEERLDDLLDDIRAHGDATMRLRQGLGSRFTLTVRDMVEALEERTLAAEFVARASFVMAGLAMMIGVKNVMAPKRGTPRNTTGDNNETISPNMEQLIAQRVAAAIEQYEANRNSGGGNGSGTGAGGAGGSGTTGGSDTAGGSGDAPNRKCTYKAFLSCNPRSFNGTEGAVGLMRWIEKMESVIDISECTADCMVKYSTFMLTDKALTWWNTQMKTLGRETAYQLSWEDLKNMMIEEYCPRNELQKIETEMWNLQMIGDDVEGYTDRFNELAIQVPHMVTPEHKRVERYLWGLAPQIRSMVTSSNPIDAKSAITFAFKLKDDAVRNGLFERKENEEGRFGEKRKWMGNSSNKSEKQGFKKQGTMKAFTVNTVERKEYDRGLPRCKKCGNHHAGVCIKCGKCDKFGHTTQACRANNRMGRIKPGCFICGDLNHFKRDCPKWKNQNNAQAPGRAFVMGARDARQDPNIVTV
ncbi:hypothetical protein L1987_19727 [Smallanthus sonchifolius]|uniref:Uncharacterized protein n=1 Tax=Smallanthus sonchifolius TaxID=185202 RepID=A0ACB9IR36_9ASTR|nr:hypothetical protein L1987_19727 [Smallanthus sonchifolius]